MLVGREPERKRIEELLDAARGGRSGSLVVEGEPGIGKSALLAWAEERAVGMRVLRTHGVERDAETPFSGLLELCRPITALLDTIPGPQATAFRGALGLETAATADRFLIGAATLSLLAAAAEDRPLLVIADDAHWLDHASLDALVFAARRLAADAVALLFARREGEGHPLALPEPDVIELRGLPRDVADALLAGTSGVPIARDVAKRLYDVTLGNPLALLELPAVIDAASLTGVSPLEEPLPVGRRVEEAFGRRAALLGDAARRALIVASVGASDELEAIAGALAALGLALDSLEEAEDAGLVQLDGPHVRFRHPLVRSAVFAAASPSERRTAHAALAHALPQRSGIRGWHLAAATLAPDESVAIELEQIALDAQQRSGFAAAASGLERAARFSGSEPEAVRRLLAAAQAASRAGQTERAIDVLAEALPRATEPTLRGELLALRGHIAHLAGDPSARDLLYEAAGLVEGTDPDRAVTMLADAVESCLYAGAAEEMLATAQRLDRLAAPDDLRHQFLAELTVGTALMMNGQREEGSVRTHRALEIVQSNDLLFDDPYYLAWAVVAPAALGRLSEARVLVQAAIRRARERGALGALPFALRFGARIDFWLGRWAEAYASAYEALDLARETQQTGQLCDCLGVLAAIEAAQGKETACREHAAEAIALATELGLARFRSFAENALGVLELASGRSGEAVRHFRQASEPKGAAAFQLSAANLIEASLRNGELEHAHEAYRLTMISFEEHPDATLRALAARCRGLLAPPACFEHHFAEALEHHRLGHQPFEEARTRLCFGERLRRAGERRIARDELTAALDVFDALGAAPWSARAAKELRASGQRLRRRDATAASQLTPQELQVALAVAEGGSNHEVGAALFLSARTVEWHLTRVYRKLEVYSRGELIRLFVGASAIEGAPTWLTAPSMERDDASH